MVRSFRLHFFLLLALLGQVPSFGHVPIPVHESVCARGLQALIDRYQTYTKTTPEQDAAFLENLEKDNPEIEGIVILDSANLKWQNDYGIQNKDAVDARAKLVHEAFEKSSRANPLIANSILFEYSDFKTGRFAYKKIPKEQKEKFREALGKAFEESNLAAEKELLLYLPPEVRTRIEQSPKRRLDSQIASWQTGGFAEREGGLTLIEVSDLASLRARFAREEFSPSRRGIPLKSNDDKIPEALDKLSQAYRDVLAIQKTLPPGFLEKRDGIYVPTLELIDIFRKAPSFAIDKTQEDVPKETSIELYVEYMKKQIELAKLPSISREQILALRDLASLGDKFSPTINPVEREKTSFEGQPVSVDIKGVGAINLQMLLKHLLKLEPQGSPKERVWEAVRAARRSEKEATDWINAQKDLIRQAALESGLTDSKIQIKMSGDDITITCTSADKKDFPARLEAFLFLLQKKAPNRFRITVPQEKILGSDRVLSASEKSVMSTQMENLEKAVRKEFNPKHIDIAFSAQRTMSGDTEVTVLLTGNDVTQFNQDKAELVVKEKLGKMPGFIFKKVKVVSK